MKKFKVGLIFVLVMGFTFVMWSGATVFAADKIILRLGHNGNAQHMTHTAFSKFKEVIEAETKGAIEAQIFPNGQLGSEEQASQMVKLGTLDASGASFGGGLAPFVPEIELFNLPFMFRDKAHFHRVFNGPIGQWIKRIIEEKLDCLVFGFSYGGTRNAWNGKRPIKVADDLKGLKIRTMSSPVMVDTWNAFGAQATPMSFGEVYSALQTGVIDGAETDMVDLLVEKFYEVTKYVSYTRHLVLGSAQVYSKKTYDKLPPHFKVAFIKAGRAAAKAHNDDQAIKNKAALGKLKELGLEFNEVDSQSFVDKIGDLYEKYSKKVGGLEAIKMVHDQ